MVCRDAGSLEMLLHYFLITNFQCFLRRNFQRCFFIQNTQFVSFAMSHRLISRRVLDKLSQNRCQPIDILDVILVIFDAKLIDSFSAYSHGFVRFVAFGQTLGYATSV